MFLSTNTDVFAIKNLSASVIVTCYYDVGVSCVVIEKMAVILKGFGHI